MRILLIALETTYNHLVPLLENEGHTVKLMTQSSEDVFLYTGYQEERLYVLNEISKFNPDLVVNALTMLILHPSSDYTYIGNTEESAFLETRKWDTRNQAKRLGWTTPPILEECLMNEMSTYDRDVYLKAKNVNIFNQGFKIPANSTLNNTMPNITAYVEEKIDFAWQIMCQFTISQESYSIRKIIGCTAGSSAGGDKLMESNGDWKDYYTLFDLTEEQDALVRSKCESWLAYAVTQGGNYEGFLEAGITADNTVYWLEQNSRPATNTLGFVSGTAQDWIEGLTVDPSRTPASLYENEN